MHLNRLPLAVVLLSVPMLGLADKGMNVCRDANGNAYFTDGGCPADTVHQGRDHLPSAQTYSGKQSIDTRVLNSWEQRNNTGKSWQWRQAPEAGR